MVGSWTSRSKICDVTGERWRGDALAVPVPERRPPRPLGEPNGEPVRGGWLLGTAPKTPERAFGGECGVPWEELDVVWDGALVACGCEVVPDLDNESPSMLDVLFVEPAVSWLIESSPAADGSLLISMENPCELMVGYENALERMRCCD